MQFVKATKYHSISAGLARLAMRRRTAPHLVKSGNMQVERDVLVKVFIE